MYKLCFLTVITFSSFLLVVFTETSNPDAPMFNVTVTNSTVPVVPTLHQPIDNIFQGIAFLVQNVFIFIRYVYPLVYKTYFFVFVPRDY